MGLLALPPPSIFAQCANETAFRKLLATLVNLPLCQLIIRIGLSAFSKNVSLATPMMKAP